MPKPDSWDAGRAKFGRVVIPAIEVEADRRLSNLALVKKRLVPSVTLVEDIPRDEVAKDMNVLLGPPMMRDEEAIDVRPVPPYNTPIDEVADTTPPFAWRGPFRVPRVNVELNALALVNVFDVYVLGIVVDALIYVFTRVSE